jgi:hypothetical protein
MTKLILAIIVVVLYLSIGAWAIHTIVYAILAGHL